MYCTNYSFPATCSPMPLCAGTDRMRRHQLRGGEMAGARQALLLGALSGERLRALPGRPRLRAQVPAVRRPRFPLRHDALQRVRHLLVLHLDSIRQRSVMLPAISSRSIQLQKLITDRSMLSYIACRCPIVQIRVSTTVRPR